MRLSCFFWGIIFLLLSACQSKPVESPTTKRPPTIEPVSKQKLTSLSGDASSSIPKAIEKSLQYLSQKGANLEPNAALVLDYLQRKFKLDKKMAFMEIYPEIPDDGRIPKFLRLMKPKHTITKADLGEQLPNGGLNDLFNMNYAMLRGLYCDLFPIDAAYLTLLKDQTALGRYFLTHAALSIQWTQENGCTELQKGLENLKEDQKDLLVEYLDKETKGSDLFAEALAVLYYIGGRDRVKQEWIEVILKSQYPDGGWAVGRISRESQDHPTVHALWALLEAQQPEVININWIPNK